MIFNRKRHLVQKNSMLWGEEVAEQYHGAAARDMQAHWDEYIEPTLRRHPIDYEAVMDFACGYGRNTDILLLRSKTVTMVDVNTHNIAYCQKKYADEQRVNVVECSGYDMSKIESNSTTFFYTFDSVVHFPKELIKSYMPEISRVMKLGAHAFIHHSNYTAGGPKADFRSNPHWRNYMSADLFAQLAADVGFEIVEQSVQPWGGVAELDCISVLKKRT